MDYPSPSILSTRYERIPYEKILYRRIFFMLLVLEFHERGAKTITSSANCNAVVASFEDP